MSTETLAMEQSDQDFDDYAKAAVAADEAAAKGSDPAAQSEIAADAVEPAEGAVEASESDDAPETKQVPLRALQEERERRKALEANQRTLEERMERLQAAWEERNKPAETRNKLPALEEDPLGHITGKISEQEQALRQFTEWQQSQLREREFVQKLSAAEQAFLQQSPDYGDATKHMISRLASAPLAQAAARANNVTPEQVAMQQARNIVEQAMATGADPAATLYAYAEMMGWQKPASAAPTQAVPAIEQARAKREAASPLSDGGTGAKPQLTIEALGKMDDEDFDKYFDQVWSKT